MKPRLVLVGLGHGQLEILDRIDELRTSYDVVYIGGKDAIYTGAFPQVIAKELDYATVHLREGIEPVASRLVSLDPNRRVVITEAGEVSYDVLVLATGAVSRGLGMAVKPMTKEGVHRIEASDAVTIVGGGKAGVELAFACIRTKRHVTLYAPDVLPDLPARVRRTMKRRLVKSGVTLVLRKYEKDACHDGLVLDTSGVVPDVWWEAAGLANADAFIETDRYLRHIDYENIFITGDMASRLNGGVDAVRSGRHVVRYLLGDRRPFRERASLNIMLTLPGHALLTYRKWTWHGRLPYDLKRFIDQRYLKRFGQ
ncbi:MULTISPECIES: NAD(P)/FAD-dependent oxidoreductase [Exiguobacterium]|uniref:NAD(P)/FAD-dependent oxidoreductase n=1 Tax=Exiguobacterium TaxID=33986 RepID=UPI001BE548F9|nr:MULTISPECIES: FAD-dependent oxidoreductase [Exiguobacterium]MCT4782188.1 FAD-dependent oxidoreductase [Exiguobacterium himgiriensis]